MRERPLLLLGGAAAVLTLVAAVLAAVIWFMPSEGGKVEGGGQTATPNVTPTASPTPVNNNSNNSRPSPTPTPNTNSNQASNSNAGGGDNKNGGDNPPPPELPRIRRLFDALDWQDAGMRKRALGTLVADYASDRAAVGEALDRLDAKLKEDTKPDAMTNLFLYLNETAYSAWTPELLRRAKGQFRHIDRVEMDGEGLTQYGIYKKHIDGLGLE